jgi:acetyl-CoA carboxylase, biotin carboxylase subunit
VKLRGHAIEVRVYAEDHENGFLPSPGTITRLIQPGGPGIREDSGIFEGWTVPIDYDPMLSKLIAYAPTREIATARLRRALEEYVVGGIRSNLGLFRRILSEPDFCAGRLDTGYLDRLLAGGLTEVVDHASGDITLQAVAIAAIATGLFQQHRQKGESRQDTTASVAPSAWKQLARREGLRP